MLNTVEKILDKYNLLNKEKTLLVGFSGGADSVCLSEIVYRLSKNFGFRMVLCHLNHNWRGEHSLSDMNFCQNFANERNLEFLTETLSKEEKQTETNARELRYKFFERCKTQVNADALLLAHNKNDRVETLIYRVVKGTGIKGLASIKENRDYIIRPLIDVSRKEIENFCADNNLNFITDSTNFENNYNRNYIRNEILPKFEKINPKYIEAINNLSKLAEDNESLINAILENTYSNILKDNKISTESFLSTSEEIKKRIILDLLIKNDLDYDSKKINEILDFIKNNHKTDCGVKYSLTTDLWLLVSSENIEIISKQKPSNKVIKITSEGEYNFENFIFKIKKYNDETPKKFPKDEDFRAFVELKEPFALPIDFELRERQEGDYIQPLGMNGTQKLKKYLNSKKIKAHKRSTLLFLCKNSEILWAIGNGISEKIKVVTKPNYVLSLEKREAQNVGFTN